jgi:beta-galactosidase
MTARGQTILSRRTALRLGAATAAWAATPKISWALQSESEVLIANQRSQPFDQGWRFLRSDAAGLAAVGLDDAAWRPLTLPHDWSIEDLPLSDPALNGVLREVDSAPLWQKPKTTPRLIGPFDAGLNDNRGYARSASGALSGFTVGGVGWYRKRFRLPDLTSDAKIEILFDGVYMNAQVWLNGALVGERPSGYAPFTVDLTPHVNRDGDNLLAVRVANLGRNSRWYAGSGIYRRVHLSITRAARFETWGLTVTTPSVSPAAASVHVAARLEGPLAGKTIAARIRDAKGAIVAEARAPADGASELTLSLAKPKLWSPDKPDLYRVECQLLEGKTVLDVLGAPLGVRQIQIDAVNGLRLNGKPLKLRGGNIHHDNGMLGACAFDRAEARKVERLKARGFNALRTAHNPPSPAFLDACDRLGMLVMEESFDAWKVAKNPDDYALYFEGWWKQDLEAMVRRDGNHPCVFMWSFGNEIPERNEASGVQTAKRLSDELRRLDPTRPVTQAIPLSTGADVIGPGDRPDQAATQFLDVAGYNYKLPAYERDHARFPERVMVGAESFPSDVDKIWRLTDKTPYVIGDFVWTAMDYLGEAAIGRTVLNGDTLADEFPWYAAGCGDLDLIGEQRPQSLLRDVVWGLSPLEITVQRPIPEGRRETPFLWGWKDELRSWTWPGAEGLPLTVNLYTRADRVVVTLNGTRLEDRPLSPDKTSIAQVQVPYQPGRLVVTAFAAGKQIGQKVLETVAAPAALRLTPERARLSADHHDLAYVAVEILDAQGRLIPDAAHVLRTDVSGPARLVGFGNANPRGVASFQQPVAKTWQGRALAILRPTGQSGVVKISVGADGLREAQTELRLG